MPKWPRGISRIRERKRRQRVAERADEPPLSPKMSTLLRNSRRTLLRKGDLEVRLARFAQTSAGNYRARRGEQTATREREGNGASLGD